MVVVIADKIQLYPPEVYARGLHCVFSSLARNHPNTTSPRVKSLNYLNNIMAKAEAKDAGGRRGDLSHNRRAHQRVYGRQHFHRARRRGLDAADERRHFGRNYPRVGYRTGAETQYTHRREIVDSTRHLCGRRDLRHRYGCGSDPHYGGGASTGRRRYSRSDHHTIDRRLRRLSQQDLTVSDPVGSATHRDLSGQQISFCARQKVSAWRIWNGEPMPPGLADNTPQILKSEQVRLHAQWLTIAGAHELL